MFPDEFELKKHMFLSPQLEAQVSTDRLEEGMTWGQSTSQRCVCQHAETLQELLVRNCKSEHLILSSHRKEKEM